MGNRGRRRAALAGAYVRDPTATPTHEKPWPVARSESGSDDGSPDASVIAAIRRVKKGRVLVRYADGARYEGAVDDEQRRHGAGRLVARSGHTFEGEWERGMLQG